MNSDKFLCSFAWNHLSVMPHGVSSICCVADHSYFNSAAVTDGERLSLKDSSIVQIINSDSYKKIRSDMLNGTVPRACQGCKRIEDNGGLSKRLKEGIDNTIDYEKITFNDGLIKPDLSHIELRLGNYCNLKCRACNAESSTSWIQDYNLLKDKVRLPSDFDGIKTNSQTYYEWCEDPAFYDELLRYSPNMKALHVSGGEPFLVPKHFYILEKLISAGKTDIQIYYITNLNYDFDKLKPALDLLTKFKFVSISFSIDDVGDRNGYIRKNSDWELMMQNLARFKAEYPSFILSVTQTVMVYNFMYVEQLYQYLSETLLMPDYNIRLNHVHSPDYLSALVIPKEVRQAKLESVKAVLPKRMYNELLGQYYNSDENMLWDEFTKTTDIVDVVRKENVRELFPALFEHTK